MVPRPHSRPPGPAAAGLLVATAAAAALGCSDGGPTLPSLRGPGDTTTATVDRAVGSYTLRTVDGAALPVATTEQLPGAVRTTELLADTLAVAADGGYRQRSTTRVTERPTNRTPTVDTIVVQATGRWTRADSVVAFAGDPVNNVVPDTVFATLGTLGRLTLRVGTSVRVYQR